MEEINSTLCKILQEITQSNIESLIEISDGFMLPNILYGMDPDFFPFEKKLSKWEVSKSMLEAYLQQNGLQDQILEFEIDNIRAGALEHIVSAVLQILAIFAVFKKEKWEVLFNKVDNETQKSLLPILTPMTQDINEALQLAKSNIISHNLPHSDDLKMLLQKMETQDIQIDSLTTRLEEKDYKLQQKDVEIRKLKDRTIKLEEELQNLHKLKDDTIKQIEDFYTAKGDVGNAEEYATKVQQLMDERDDYKESLQRHEMMIADRDEEIEKLTLMRTAYENHKHEMDNYLEQIEYFKDQTDRLKNECEVKASRIKLLERSDGQLKALKDKIKAQGREINELKIDKMELENSVKVLEKKMITADEKVEFIRQKSMNNLKPPEDLIKDSNYTTRLEEENERLKRLNTMLRQHFSDNEIKKLDQELLEKDQQMYSSKVKSLMMEKSALLEKNQLHERNALARSNVINTFSYKNLDTLEEVDESGINGFTQNLDDLASSQSIEDNDRAIHNTENVELMYNVCMEFMQNELMNIRMLLPRRAERKRDIFERFKLSNVIKETI